jgi:hypothetical protein
VLDGTVILGNTMQASSPTYSAPVAVQSVSGPLRLRTAGKNLLTLETATKAGTDFGVSWTIADGKITLSGTCRRPGSNAFIMPMGSTPARALYFPAGNYVLSGLQADYTNLGVRLYVNVYNAAGTALSTYGTYSQTGVAFTLSEGAWLTVNIRIADGAVADGVVVYPQLEAGSVQTAFEAFCGHTYSVPLTGTDGQTLAPLRRVYSGASAPKTPYMDRIFRRDGKWVVERNTGAADLTSATWVWTSSGKYITPKINGASIKAGVATYWALSNYFPSRGSGDQIDGVWSGTDALVIGNKVLPYSETTTAEQMAAFCKDCSTAGTPVMVYYPVATPTYETLSDAAQVALDAVRTSLGDKMMCCDNAPQVKLQLEYAKSLNLVVDKLSAAIVAIGGAI